MDINHATSFRRWAGLCAAIWLCLPISASANTELRICAEPDNLPFSNQQQQGFENKIAALLADDLQLKPSFVWEKQRQGYIRSTLGADRCDAIMGVPAGFERVTTTQPYYRSSYVFITHANAQPVIDSYDDPRLQGLKIGLHAIGNDGSNSPPAHSLSKRGLAKQIVGYSLWGDSTVTNPQGQVVDAVAKGEVDMAIVWGPFGGYFARPYGDQLTVSVAQADAQLPMQASTYDIAIGVKKGNQALADSLTASLEKNREKIQAILQAYNVPTIQSNSGAILSASDHDETTQPNHP